MNLEFEDRAENQNVDVAEQEIPSKKNEISGYLFFAAIVIVGILWFALRPGVFTVQPIGALPDGVTIIYRQRGANMAFFSSPDRMCLDTHGSVSLLCRGMAISAAVEIFERKLIQLPYLEWAYLRSTDGREFDR